MSKLCKFYLHGECKNGTVCPYSHCREMINVPRSVIVNEWGIQNDDVYFYGAAGRLSRPAALPIASSYVAAVKSSIADGDLFPKETADKATTKDTSTNNICFFFEAGSCRFGARCRNQHIVSKDAVEVPLDEVGSTAAISTTTPSLECGICMGTPSGSALYGLLSHCDCIFCLKCIREWRREGLVVALKGEQLRLCPLCRKESYFICPSSVPLIGLEKLKSLEAFKRSISAKPCKYLRHGEECPFGSSCLYSHEFEGLPESATLARRSLMAADGRTELLTNINRKITIADVLMQQRQQSRS